jgi:transcriptional regulator with XRE-family HTH domain
MEDTLNNGKKEREVSYYRQRFKNRVFASISAFFSEEFERTGLTRKEIALCLGRDPAQITRWLSEPTNLTLDTISDLLYAAKAEMDTPVITRLSDKRKPNYAHPLIAKIASQPTERSSKPVQISTMPTVRGAFNVSMATPPNANLRAFSI